MPLLKGAGVGGGVGGRHKPRNAGSLEKLEKAKDRFSPRLPPEGTQPCLDFSSVSRLQTPELEDNKSVLFEDCSNLFSSNRKQYTPFHKGGLWGSDCLTYSRSHIK